MALIRLSLAVVALVAFASIVDARDRCPVPGSGPGTLHQEDSDESGLKRILLDEEEEEEEDEEPDCE